MSRKGRGWGLLAIVSLSLVLPGCGAAGQGEERVPVDIDLSGLNTTMAYSQAMQILMEPAEYDGKTLRAQGIFNSFRDMDTEELYFVCGVPDATGCCSASMEFDLGEGITYPEDYPGEFDEIVVRGTLEAYEDGGYEGCILREAVWEETIEEE